MSTFEGKGERGHRCCSSAAIAPLNISSNTAVTPTHDSIRIISPLVPRYRAHNRRIAEQGKRHGTNVKIHEEK